MPPKEDDDTSSPDGGDSVGTDCAKELTKEVDKCVSDNEKERAKTEHFVIGGEEGASQCE